MEPKRRLIEELCREAGFPIEEINDHIPDLHVSRRTITDWKAGVCRPRGKNARIVADFFGVPVEEVKSGGYLGKRDIRFEEQSYGVICPYFTVRRGKTIYCDQNGNYRHILQFSSVQEVKDHYLSNCTRFIQESSCPLRQMLNKEYGVNV